MKVVSFFSGCGGLDLGFEQVGFQVINQSSLSMIFEMDIKWWVMQCRQNLPIKSQLP